MSALSYLHKNNIAHKDLHLGNICLDEDDNILLIDFGCSGYFEKEKKGEFIFCGKAQYSPPEMFTKAPYIGNEIDIWSFGVCLCKIVTGYLPFTYSTDIMKGEFCIDLDEENISDNCKDLIKTILNINNRIYDFDEIKNHPFWLNVHLEQE